MKRIALIDIGTVVNVASWDGVTPWSPIEPGVCDTTVDITGDPAVTIGAAFTGPTGWLVAGTFGAAPAPLPAPSPASFAAAVLADALITASVRLVVANWEPSLTSAIAAGNATIISQVWALLVSEYSISTSDQSAVAALATANGIPGITAP